MKKYLLADIALISCLFILSVNFASALAITEIEANPSGVDFKNEWIEFYSDETINLTGYKIQNGDGGVIYLNESFSGYYIYRFAKQWLDNNDERVLLYKNTELISETKNFSDTYNNDKTLQDCNGEWEFLISTIGAENDCGTDASKSQTNTQTSNPVDSSSGNINQPNQQQNSADINNSESTNEIKSNNISNQNQNENRDFKSKNVINLNPSVPATPEKAIYESKNEKIGKYAIYGFALFLIFVIVVLIIKK